MIAKIKAVLMWTLMIPGMVAYLMFIYPYRKKLEKNDGKSE